ncbi:MAG: hypothetical protein NC395_05240 [Prevotella sp.]|nr:hypothetical protein [Prevotella sp.]
MGFFQAVNGSEMNAEKLSRFWGEARPERAENGVRVILRENEVLIHIKDGKAADVIAEAGGYIYHSDIENSPDTKSYAEVFDGFSERRAGFFGDKETVIISVTGGVSPGNFGKALSELAGEKAVREVPSAPVSQPGGGWICSCGTENTGVAGFCKKCGNARPQTAETAAEPEKKYVPEPQSPQTADVPARSGVMWICGKCGSKNEYSFCKNCGASRTKDSEICSKPKPAYTPPQQEIFGSSSGSWICGNCGNKNEYSFCKSCGASRPAR